MLKLKTFCYFIALNTFMFTSGESDFCEIDGNRNDNNCLSKTINSDVRYILYDTNRPEGFNLRRDVYMRMAVFMYLLMKSKDKNLNKFKLVLPPWHELYHWKNKKINKHVPWSHFFDLESLNEFVPVVEMYEFFNDFGTNYKKIHIDDVYNLQHFEDMFKSGKFEEKMTIVDCKKDIDLNFYEYENITSDNIQCLSFHGFASQLTNILKSTNAKTIFFNHAEIALHDQFGSRLYWQARRSMRFNRDLRKVADSFRYKYLNSNDESDNTRIPEKWKDEKPHRNAKGGSYICVHLRRRDFLWGRPNDVPEIENAVKQIKILLVKYNLNTVFIATDAPKKEYEELKQKLSPEYQVHKLIPDKTMKQTLSDGAIAIVEQIICSHAFYFIGTHESTFSFRIQEEREILGFPVNHTFNRLCGNSETNCENPSIWKIVF